MRWFSGWLGLVVCVVATLLLGGVIGALTGASASDWYQSLRRPSWNPPSAVFGPVWSLLYVSMGVALWLACRARPESASLCLAVYGLQLALNLVWPMLFFGLRSPGLALIGIALLWPAIALAVIVFWRATPAAGALMLPYLAWVSFAAWLNAAIWRLNA